MPSSLYQFGMGMSPVKQCEQEGGHWDKNSGSAKASMDSQYGYEGGCVHNTPQVEVATYSIMAIIAVIVIAVVTLAVIKKRKNNKEK